MMDRILHQQQIQVMAHKKYFIQKKMNHSSWLIVILLIPFLWLGWKVSSEKWITRITTQLVELMMLTFVTYSRKQLINFLNLGKVVDSE